MPALLAWFVGHLHSVAAKDGLRRLRVHHPKFAREITLKQSLRHALALWSRHPKSAAPRCPRRGSPPAGRRGRNTIEPGRPYLLPRLSSVTKQHQHPLVPAYSITSPQYPSDMSATAVKQASASGNAVPRERAWNRFDHLVAALKKVLGPSSGLNSDDVNVADLEALMQDYQTDLDDWSKYAFSDASRGYTRNLVDEGNGKSNLVRQFHFPKASGTKR